MCLPWWSRQQLFMSLKCKHTNSFLLQEELAFPLTPTAVLQMGLTLRSQTFYGKHTDTHTPCSGPTLPRHFLNCFSSRIPGKGAVSLPPAHGQDMTGLTIYSLSGPAGVLRVTLPPTWLMTPCGVWTGCLVSWVSCSQQRQEDHTVSDITSPKMRCGTPADLLCWQQGLAGEDVI